MSGAVTGPGALRHARSRIRVASTRPPGTKTVFSGPRSVARAPGTMRTGSVFGVDTPNSKLPDLPTDGLLFQFLGSVTPLTGVTRLAATAATMRCWWSFCRCVAYGAFADSVWSFCGLEIVGSFRFHMELLRRCYERYHGRRRARLRRRRRARRRRRRHPRGGGGSRVGATHLSAVCIFI